MKLFYTLVFFLSFSLVSIAQTYTPFLAEGKVWVVDYLYEPEGWHCDVPYGGGECYTEYYKLSGDTIINNTSYQILWLRQRNNSIQAQNNSYGNFIRHAYLREDLIAQQVYMHRLSTIFDTYCSQTELANAEEVKIYDFSLNINESLDRCAGSYVIGNKYYDDALNGDTLVKFNEDYQECIGGFQGPTRYFFIVERESAYLQCVYLNGEAIYGSCSPQLLNVTSSSKEIAELKIYPNQVEDKLTLISGVNQTINIYDLLGNVVHSEPISKGETVIDLHFLAPQLYIVKGNTVSKKIVKLYF